MNITRPSTVFLFTLIAGAFACGSQGADQGDPAADQGALTQGGASNENAVDEKVVGIWLAKQDDPKLLFNFGVFNADGTYEAQGGCHSADQSRAARCFPLTQSAGKWTAKKSGDSTQIVLTDSLSHVARTYFVKLDGDTAKVSESAEGEAATFKRQTGKVAPGKVCGASFGQGTPAACVEGYECKSNCPVGAMCFAAIDTCQPIPAIQSGGVCDAAARDSHCAEGLVCKSNCPAGAMCFAVINTCQPQ